MKENFATNVETGDCSYRQLAKWQERNCPVYESDSP